MFLKIDIRTTCATTPDVGVSNFAMVDYLYLWVKLAWSLLCEKPCQLLLSIPFIPETEKLACILIGNFYGHIKIFAKCHSKFCCRYKTGIWDFPSVPHDAKQYAFMKLVDSRIVVFICFHDVSPFAVYWLHDLVTSNPWTSRTLLNNRICAIA